MLDDILEKIPETFNMAEIMAKAAEKTPYVVVAFQECERMNILTNEMRRSLKELNLGLKVKTVGQPGQGQGLVKLAGPCLTPPPPQSGILCPPIQAKEGGRLLPGCDLWRCQRAMPCWQPRTYSEGSPPS